MIHQNSSVMENWENFNIAVETASSASLRRQFQDDKPKSKFHWSWRINQLALPKGLIGLQKEVPPEKPAEPEKKRVEKIDPECEWRSIQLANPNLLRLINNKKDALTEKHQKIYDKYINNTLNSIYYYYYKKRRDLERKRRHKQKLARERAKKRTKQLKKEEIEKIHLENLNRLAIPRPKLKPPPIPRVRKDLEALMPGIERLSQPQKHEELPPKPPSPSPWSLKYEITARTEQLAEVPEWRRYVPPPPPPPERPRIKIKDMKIVLSERMQQLVQPRPKRLKKDEDLKEDPWTIPPNALKYKATPRILELSKPIERD